MSRFGVFPNLPKQKNGVFGLRFFMPEFFKRYSFLELIGLAAKQANIASQP